MVDTFDNIISKQIEPFINNYLYNNDMPRINTYKLTFHMFSQFKLLASNVVFDIKTRSKRRNKIVNEAINSFNPNQMLYALKELDVSNSMILYLAVDKQSWPEAKKMELAEFISTAHIEKGPVDLSALTPGLNVLVEEDFETSFLASGYYLRVDAYRIETRSGGVQVRVSIPFHTFQNDTDGFSLVLSELKVGDVINYIGLE